MCFIRGTVDIPHSRRSRYTRALPRLRPESAWRCRDSMTPTLWHPHSVVLDYLGTSLFLDPIDFYLPGLNILVFDRVQICSRSTRTGTIDATPPPAQPDVRPEVTGGGSDLDSGGRGIELKVCGLLHIHLLQRVLRQYQLLQYRVITSHHNYRHHQVLSDEHRSKTEGGKGNSRGREAVVEAEVWMGTKCSIWIGISAYLLGVWTARSFRQYISTIGQSAATTELRAGSCCCHARSGCYP
ncbi:hypothetical protein Scep_004709 [Stephania cephalantha]|uniref:Uncharacterized protein n=1 Tax=Stephania cephalantha TaxID=152367 RepID=A0AAP0KTV4_9MAGN